MEHLLILSYKLEQDLVVHNSCHKLFKIAQSLNIDNIDTICINIATLEDIITIPEEVLNIIPKYSTVIVHNDEISNQLLAQIAGHHQYSIIGNVVQFISPEEVVSARYNGTITANIINNSPSKLYSVSCSHFELSNLPDKIDNITVIDAKVDKNIIKHKDSNLNYNETTEELLKKASTIVVGGIGLKTSLNFEALIIGLSNKLNGQYAGSLLAAEQKLIPMERHIGQSGVSVSPNLYLAIGISGAPQHMVGVNNAKTIIAINNDPNAAIFQYADYGIIGDLFEIVPKLLEQL